MKKITDENFDNYLDTTRGMCVIFFYANWAGACQQFKINFAQIENDYRELYFSQLEVDPNPDTWNRFSVSGVPCVKVFEQTDEGTTVLGTLYGDSTKEQLKQFINKHV